MRYVALKSNSICAISRRLAAARSLNFTEYAVKLALLGYVQINGHRRHELPSVGQSWNYYHRWWNYWRQYSVSPRQARTEGCPTARKGLYNYYFIKFIFILIL